MNPYFSIGAFALSQMALQPPALAPTTAQTIGTNFDASALLPHTLDTIDDFCNANGLVSLNDITNRPTATIITNPDGSLLYGRNPDAPVAFMSVMKTAVTIPIAARLMEEQHYQLNTPIKLAEADSQSLPAELTFGDLMAYAHLESDNTAAIILGYLAAAKAPVPTDDSAIQPESYYPDEKTGKQDIAVFFNQILQNIEGVEKTFFADPSGLPDTKRYNQVCDVARVQQTTPREFAAITHTLMQNMPEELVTFLNKDNIQVKGLQHQPITLHSHANFKQHSPSALAKTGTGAQTDTDDISGIENSHSGFLYDPQKGTIAVFEAPTALGRDQEMSRLQDYRIELKAFAANSMGHNLEL